jgi:endonuclease-3
MLVSDIPKVMAVLKKEYARLRTPAVTEVAEELRASPFRVLVSCIISLRTKDDVTRAASGKLLSLASTPEAMARLKPAEVEKAIYPAGFYRTKARTLIDISRELVERRSSLVPDTLEGLLELKGVGRKTANLVLTLGFGKPGICVDTHVHRITNRWGLVSTKTPEETEYALREILPARYWIPINDLLVAYGQNVCGPASPFCGSCKIAGWCERRGVKRSRTASLRL